MSICRGVHKPNFPQISPFIHTLQAPLCRLLGNPPPLYGFWYPHGFCIDPVLLSIRPLRIGHLDRPIPTMHIPTMYNFWDEALLASWSCNPVSLRLIPSLRDHISLKKSQCKNITICGENINEKSILYKKSIHIIT